MTDAGSARSTISGPGVRGGANCWVNTVQTNAWQLVTRGQRPEVRATTWWATNVGRPPGIFKGRGEDEAVWFCRWGGRDEYGRSEGGDVGLGTWLLVRV
mmetsp:Transcript_26352/g.55771  ORF Transcript_26352/g.55771 Transcript_26352/m.55771 type:complete len:99 (+) Transcript_26352:187-483(+)